jgi:cytosine/adenosine deaminase-related metal-dependent hydrolase
MHVESVETLRGYHEAGIRVAFHPPVVDQNMLVYGDDREFVDALSGDVRDIAETLLAATQLSQEDYFELCDNLYKAHHDSVNALVHIQVSPAGGQWCSDELILKAVEFAKQNQTRVQMHMLETHLQEKYAYRKWSKSFLKHLDEIGALGPWLTLAHMIWIAPEDFSLLAKRGVAIAHNPSSNLRVRSGIAALTNMVNAEIPLGIGLDGFALDEDQDYLREMRLALTLANHRSNQPGSRSMPLSAQTILHMGTHGGAQVTLGDDIRLGKLAKGYFADLIVLDLNFSPLDFLSDDSGLTESILRLASRKHVKHVMVAGEWLVKNGKHVRLDEESLHSEIVRCLRKQPRPSNHPAINDAKTLAPYVTAYYERWQKE